MDQLRNHDPYMVVRRLRRVRAAAKRDAAELLSHKPREWARRALHNIAGASAFSSDATIRAYADEIWNVVPIKAHLPNIQE